MMVEKITFPPERILAARNGDQEVLSALLVDVFKLAKSYVFNRVYRLQIAEDLAQDTVVGVLTGLARYEDRGIPFKNFLFGMVSAKLKAYRRRRFYYREIEFSDLEQSDDIHVSDIEQEMIDNTRIDKIRQYLPSLRERQLQAINAYYFGHPEDNAALASRYDNDVAIRALRFRALQSLRNRLMDE